MMEIILQAVADFRCLPPDINLRIAKPNRAMAVVAILPVDHPMKKDMNIISRELSIILREYCMISMELVSWGLARFIIEAILKHSVFMPTSILFIR
nr:hypothetical protein [Paenibacillus sp. FSL R7-277]